MNITIKSEKELRAHWKAVNARFTGCGVYENDMYFSFSMFILCDKTFEAKKADDLEGGIGYKYQWKNTRGSIYAMSKDWVYSLEEKIDLL